ncbi:hypothetical protein ACFP1Z_22405 [Streptomyces gamaensis]|uniref:DUF11 domain-containing protein n=1 Tax=Streptomyces gamaensis TaxID=1763542 RepID=A0ABW0Z3A4_9ACTN
MRRTTLRRAALSATLALGAGLLGFAQPASAAAPVPMTVTVDKQTATPGSTVNLTLTFTNTESTNVQFVYQSIQPSYDTSQDVGLKYAFTSCTGDVSACDVAAKQSGSMRYNVPVTPGATRTVKLSYQIAADSACGPSRRIDFYSYLYYEYQAGQQKKDGVYPVGTAVTCTGGNPAAAAHK